MSDRYFAFISYASSQGDWVARLQRNLERCLDHHARKVDPDISRRVFLDRVDLRSGKSWVDQLQEAVDQSDRLILVMSPEAVASDWVRLEWQSFLTTRPNDLFPLRLAEAELPAFLRTIQWLDFSGAEGETYRQRLTELFGDLLRRSRRDPPPLPDGLELSSAPEPSFTSDETRELSNALDEAYRQRAETLASGGDVTTLNETIVGIKRQLRAGPQLQAGDFLLEGRFHLLEQVGKGGFATVWKAYDRERQDLAAVKVLHSQYSEDKGRRERFFRGARHMAKLRHPGIVAVIEAECDDGGYHFFAMEYVAGGDFRQAVLEGRLSIAERLAVVLAVGDALTFAHGQGVIHRDVKPANILLDLEGRPKLTDFDLVRAADTTGGTRTAMMGTILYAAPEAMLDGKQAAEPADVYGLGMTAVFALHGAKLPGTALWELPALITALKVDDRCRAVLLSAVARDLPDRLGTMSSFCTALSDALKASSLLAAEPVSPQAPAVLTSRGEQSIRERRHERDGSVLVYVPGGQYTLGADDVDDDSRPIHRVTLSPFWIGKHPVTNEQYRRFVEGTGHQEAAYWDEDRFKAPLQPVVGVSWFDAKAYVEWAGLSLPSESQWEAAARGTDQRRYPWGDEAPTSDLADFGKDWQTESPDPVGSHSQGAGPFGAEDQAGGVWEWCEDSWNSKAYANRDGSIDPMTPLPEGQGESSSYRVLRGGSWNGPSTLLPAAIRGRGGAGIRYQGVGFRVVCGSAPES